MNILLHKHHIIPRHIGGSNDPSNLVELTVEDHAIAHKVLYGFYSRWQDKLAWETLSGRITKEQAIREVGSKAHLGIPHSAEIRAKISAAKMGKTFSPAHRIKLSAAHMGKQHSSDTRVKLSIAMKGNTRWLGLTHSPESRMKMRIARKKYWANKVTRDGKTTRRKLD